MGHLVGFGIAAAVMILAAVVSTLIKRREKRGRQALRNRLAKSQLDHEAGQ